jgi:DNA (cytosine-5)-methyltransferase 1
MKYFSTFTGIGGLDWGLEKNRVECVGFSEIRESSIKVYLSHYPGRKNFGDITQIDPESLPDFDMYVGGFPCQSFSLAGERQGFKDRRGQMIFYIYDILVVKKPEYVVLENVKGIITHDHGRTYRSVFKLLWSAGYFVRVILFNSAHYGSAQARERVVFLCRKGKDFSVKNPEKKDDSKRFRDFREKGVKFRWLSERALARLAMDKGGFLPIGGYDRVNTLTTGISSSGRDTLFTDEGGKFRGLTTVEGERLQGFPDGWTEGVKESDRWFAIGNAVNCKVSEYLFTDYLKGLWW